MPLTTSQQISIGALCSVYTSNELASGKRTGGVMDTGLPVQIYAVNQGLKWLYEYDPTNSDLVPIGNYLISICRQQFRAESVLALNNGGTVAPIVPGGSSVNDLDFIVSATSIIETGESSITFDGTNGNPDFRGLNVNFARGASVMYTTPDPDGGVYYGWNKVTGLFQLLGPSSAAGVGERFRIMPDTTGGSSGSSTGFEPTTILLSADGTYTLPEGYLIWKISILPTAADTVKIGTTVGGDDIMFDKLMTTGVYGTNGVTTDVYAESADKIIYFTGFTAQATINIYLLPI